MGDNLNLKIGQLVELNDGRVGTIRFVGDTAFAEGYWVGVEFEDATGKNDGSVQGIRYFDSKPGHGMFLRTMGVSRIIEEPKPKAPAKATGRPAAASVSRARGGGSIDQGKGRPSSMAPESSTRPKLGSRPSSIDTKSPAAPTTRIGSPTKRPVSTVVSRSRPSISTGTTAPGRRTSTVSSSTATKPAPSPTPAAAARHAPRPSVSGTRGGMNRTGSGESATAKAPARQSLAPTKRPSPTGTGSRSPSSPTAAPALAQRSVSSAQKEQEIKELQTKLRLLEQKRTEDREKIAILDRVQEERNKYEQIIQKLQAKYQPLSQENNELKKQLKEAEGRLEQVEAIQTEHESIMEMATLDREMAEEQAEAYKTDLDAAKQRLEELELENEILKDENQELGQEMSPEERTSRGWIQMERENERLREALLRLRDITQESEAELRDHIRGLEEDVQELSGVKEQYDDTKARLLEAEADIEDLRQQLDAALGAEEMIEELTEKNLSLNEYIDQLKVATEELEILKELNEELEVNHVENEKELQEQIDFKDSVISEQNRRAFQQDETLSDQEYTIMRFRELVTNLQSDMEDMRASKEISESEAQELNSRSRAMMDLNRQLQNSASSTKVKTIDMELRKLDAQEAAEHLSIVQLFLPEAFHSERESVLALLRFKRIGFKAQLVHNFVKDKVSGDAPVTDEDIFEACDVLDKLTWVSAMCDRFITAISTCSLDRFARFEGTLYELEPVERALNGYIEGLKRDELKERQVAEELHRSIAVMSHLAETHLGESLEGYADDILMRTLLMQSHLETTAAALSLVKGEVQARIPASGEEEDDGVERFVQKTESMIAASRSAKVIVGKTLRSVQELKTRSLTLHHESSPPFEECQDLAEDLAVYVRKLGENVFRLLHEDSRTEPFTISEVRSIMFKTSEAVFSVSESDMYTTFGAKLRKLSEELAELGNMTSDLEMTVEFERTTAPWVLRSKELQDSKIVSIDAEEEIRRLKEEVHARVTQIKLQEQRHEEATVKIELLESRTRDASKKTQRITELEHKFEDSKTREKQLAEALETQVRDLAALETEKEKWKTQAELAKAAEAAVGEDPRESGGEKTVATKREIDALKTDIRYLEAANRFLRQSNRREHITNTGASNSWLQAPLVPAPPRPASTALDAAPGVPRHRKVLQEITNLPSMAKLVDLKVEAEDGEGPRSKLKWRPMKSTPQWQLSEQEVRRAEAWDRLWSGKGLGYDDDDGGSGYEAPWGMSTGVGIVS